MSHLAPALGLPVAKELSSNTLSMVATMQAMGLKALRRVRASGHPYILRVVREEVNSEREVVQAPREPIRMQAAAMNMFSEPLSHCSLISLAQLPTERP